MKHPKTCFLPASLSSSFSASPSLTSPSKSNFSGPFRSIKSHAQKTSGQRGALTAPTPRPEFIELLARTNFSFLQGASHPEEMVLQAKRLGYKGLSICDVNGLYGIVRGYQAAEKPSAFDTEQLAHTNADGSPKEPFQYICGTELTCHDASPVVLIPMNKEGYTRLCHLITQAKRRAPKGHIVVSINDLLEENDNLIAIPLPPWKEKDLQKIQMAFQDRVYLPVQKDFSWESVRLYQQALSLEQSLGIALFATQRPLFHEPSRKPLHDVLTCILHKSTLAEASTRLTVNRERYLKSPAEIFDLFRERPDLIHRTVEIAARIQFSLKELKYKYPQSALPPGKTAADVLRELVEEGLKKRYANVKSLIQDEMQKLRLQVDKELALIQELEYEDYFLTLKEICDFAAAKKILFQGRGSAANSVVCFALGLTAINPVKMELLFERFMSRERGEPPDIDIDFEHERREEVIQHIYAKYGEQRAAMVCTVICYRSRMATREVAKVMGIPLAQIDALIKFMGREGLSRLIEISDHEKMRAANKSLTANRAITSSINAVPPPPSLESFGLTPETFELLLQLALELKGFPRHLGIHSGGFVISHEPIVDIVPVESASMNQRYVIQWNKDDINTLGLMKIDVLSLGMLTAIRKSLAMLRSHKDIHMDLASIPHDDKPTYDMICKADTVGVFQIESRAQMSLLPRLRPKCYYDLVIQVAIVRPGPIQGGMVHPYLKRRSGQEQITYSHPKLVPVLKRTLGIPLFQEQIMQIVSAVAGFTPGEADELRRIMSSAWRKTAIMDGLHQRVVNGMISNNISREYAERIYKTIEGFASYGFPESHAASFALLTYASCYLKHHHPDVFACALLNSQPMGFYSPRQLIADAQRHGVQFFPLDVQKSDWDFELEEPSALPTQRQTTSGLWLKSVAAPASTSQSRQSRVIPMSSDSRSDTGHASGRPTPSTESINSSLKSSNGFHAVRTGFRSVYGLRESFVKTIVDERKRNGAYLDLADLIRRTRIPKNIALRLGAADAFTCFGISARESVWVVQGLSFDAQSLFFGSHQGLDEERQDTELEELPEESEWQSVHREYKTKGFAIDSHPMSVLRPFLLKSKTRYSTSKSLETLRHRTPIRVAGLTSLMQKPPTAKGMCFLSMEDETGLFNVVITPDLYQSCRMTLIHEPLLEIEGILESREGVRNVRATIIRPLIRK